MKGVAVLLAGFFLILTQATWAATATKATATPVKSIEAVSAQSLAAKSTPTQAILDQQRKGMDRPYKTEAGKDLCDVICDECPGKCDRSGNSCSCDYLSVMPWMGEARKLAAEAKGLIDEALRRYMKVREAAARETKGKIHGVVVLYQEALREYQERCRGEKGWDPRYWDKVAVELQRKFGLKLYDVYTEAAKKDIELAKKTAKDLEEKLTKVGIVSENKKGAGELLPIEFFQLTLRSARPLLSLTEPQKNEWSFEHRGDAGHPFSLYSKERGAHDFAFSALEEIFIGAFGWSEKNLGEEFKRLSHAYHDALFVPDKELTCSLNGKKQRVDEKTKHSFHEIFSKLAKNAVSEFANRGVSFFDKASGFFECSVDVDYVVFAGGDAKRRPAAKSIAGIARYEDYVGLDAKAASLATPAESYPTAPEAAAGNSARDNTVVDDRSNPYLSCVLGFLGVSSGSPKPVPMPTPTPKPAEPAPPAPAPAAPALPATAEQSPATAEQMLK
ncbi:MAG: hypothetical protein HYW49_06460 [Deltaproteobacteria bacterium]|nr:hypothetical protein [Deltaproteobacteria bacterium]